MCLINIQICMKISCLDLGKGKTFYAIYDEKVIL
jgi:hypothetical protein